MATFIRGKLTLKFLFKIYLKEWRRRVRYVDSRDEILNVFRQTVEWIISERMENECRIECVNEHEIQRMETGNVQGVGNLIMIKF